MSKPRRKFCDSIEEQTRLWAEGDPRHNRTRDECCPDFSCCDPKLLWSVELRQRFVAAGDAERERMMFQGLAGMLRAQGYKVTSSRLTSEA